MSFNNRYPSFKPTNAEGIKTNDPKNKRVIKRCHFLNKTGARIYKPKDGDGLVRFFPQMNQSYFAYSTALHYVGYDSSSFVCPTTYGDECPVCAYRDKLYRANDTAWKDYKKANTHLGFILDRNNEVAGPQLWLMTDHVLKSFHNKLQDRNGAIRSIDDLDNGRDIFFKRGKENENTDFSKILEVEVDNPTPITDDAEKLDRWIKVIEEFPFPESLTTLPKKRIEELMFGEASNGSSTPSDSERYNKSVFPIFDSPIFGSPSEEEEEDLSEAPVSSPSPDAASEVASEKPSSDLQSRLKRIKEKAAQQ